LFWLGSVTNCGAGLSDRHRAVQLLQSKAGLACP
jgi:hypothetical protein